MDKKNPYIIDIKDLDLENFIVDEEENAESSVEEADYPFEFSKTKLWSESFFDVEANADALSSLLQEVMEIKQLVVEIRERLPS